MSGAYYLSNFDSETHKISQYKAYEDSNVAKYLNIFYMSL